MMMDTAQDGATTPPDRSPSEAVILEKFHFRVFGQFSPSELAERETRTLTLETLGDTGEMWRCELRDYVYGQSIRPVTIRYPATWWQAFKEAYLPRWMLSRWPIVYAAEVFNPRILYPLVRLPDEGATRCVLHVERQRRREVDRHSFQGRGDRICARCGKSYPEMLVQAAKRAALPFVAGSDAVDPTDVGACAPTDP